MNFVEPRSGGVVADVIACSPVRVLLLLDLNLMRISNQHCNPMPSMRNQTYGGILSAGRTLNPNLKLAILIGGINHEVRRLVGNSLHKTRPIGTALGSLSCKLIGFVLT